MILFGGKSRTRQVPGGRQLQRRCDGCGCERTFVECEIEDAIDVFFIPVLQGRSRRLVCVECGDDVELEAQPAARPTPSAAAVRRTFSEREKDDLLAALKRMRSSGKAT